MTQAMPVVSREAVERKFMSMQEELESRAFAAGCGLCPCDREEFVAECVAWSWAWMLTAAEKGRLDLVTPYWCATFARKMWNTGRRFGMSASINDAMDEQARAKGRVGVENLESIANARCESTARGRMITKALTDSRHARPDQVVRAEHDFGLVRDDPSLSERAGQLFERLLLDNEAGHGVRIAKELGISPGRVTQLKRGELAPSLERLGYAPAAAG